jgi:hypothetical protein
VATRWGPGRRPRGGRPAWRRGGAAPAAGGPLRGATGGRRCGAASAPVAVRGTVSPPHGVVGLRAPPAAPAGRQGGRRRRATAGHRVRASGGGPPVRAGRWGADPLQPAASRGARRPRTQGPSAPGVAHSATRGGDAPQGPRGGRNAPPRPARGAPGPSATAGTPAVRVGAIPSHTAQRSPASPAPRPRAGTGGPGARPPGCPAPGPGGWGRSAAGDAGSTAPLSGAIVVTLRQRPGARRTSPAVSFLVIRVNQSKIATLHRI